MSWDWHWISWYKGTPFQWGEIRLNSGNPYKSYRFGPLLIRVFMMGAKQDRQVLNRKVELSRASWVNARKQLTANDNFAPEMRLAA